jgi:hypothetical protein
MVGTGVNCGTQNGIHLPPTEGRPRPKSKIAQPDGRDPDDSQSQKLSTDLGGAESSDAFCGVNFQKRITKKIRS